MKKVLILVLCLFLFANPVLADSPSPLPTPTPNSGEVLTPINPDEIYDLPQFLEMLSGPLGWLALGVFASLVLRKVKWYEEQPSETKKMLQVSLTVILSVLSWSVFNFVPKDVLVDLTPVFEIIAGVILTFSGSDLAYLFFVRPNKS